MNTPPVNEMPYRKAAVAIFLNSQDEILIVQKTAYSDKEWDLPGGGIEEGETPEEGIARELEEELGTKNFQIISKSSIINRFEWPPHVIDRGFLKRNKWYRGQEKFQFLVRFSGTQDELAIQKEEIKNAKWVKPSELEQYFIFPNQLSNIQEVLKDFNLE